MLLLFDIDGTLLTTGGAGIHAMEAAGVELFGPGFSGRRVEYAGRLDPLIIDDLLVTNGLEVTEDRRAALKNGYRRHLPRILTERQAARTCPGVPTLIDRLAAEPEAILALLTGNYEETGRIKLEASGLSPERFTVRVWGDASPHHPPRRDHLPPVGMRMARERHGRHRDGWNVVVIGDTPHDIACARAHGLRSLGVGTGQYSVEALLASGADLAVPTLEDTERIVSWMMQAAERGG